MDSGWYALMRAKSLVVKHCIPLSNHVLFRPQIMLIFVGKYMFDEFTGKDVLRG